MGQPKLKFLSDDHLKNIRDKKIQEGLDELKSTLSNLDIDVKIDRPTPKVEPVAPRYNEESLSEMARRLYRENIKPVIDEPKADVKIVADTYANRVNIKALSKALVGMRNPDNGDEGKIAPHASDHGGNKSNPMGSYHALTTSMTLEEYQDYIAKKFVKENEEVEEVVEQEPELLVEKHPAIDDLESRLVEMSDTSWVAIDKVMREIAAEHNITPKQLHKDFKAEHGMIPDDWAKENSMMEESGWMPLDEAVALNKVGQVYEVTFMYKCVTKRIKFFWPQVGIPSKQEMQDVVTMLYPTAVLVAYYPSTHCGDNKDNFMVLVAPSTPRSVVMRKEDWEPMSDEESLAYEMIITEEGNPISPPLIVDGGIELLIEDYDTGEERIVVIGENKSGDSSLHDWFNKSKSSDGKKGWVQLGGKYSGKPCARQPGQTTKPKCGSSKMKRNLDKDEEQAAFRRKNAQDPNPNRSGKAKNVATEEVILEKEGKKDACYNKVKSRYKVWPSAYASGALVKCRQKGASNWGNSSKKEEFEPMDEACWKGYTKKGMKTMFGKRYPNCVKKEETEIQEDMSGMSQKSGDKRSTESGAGMTAKGVAKYNRRTGGNLKTAVTTPPSKLKPGSKAANRRKSFCARSRSWTGERGKAARRRWNC